MSEPEHFAVIVDRHFVRLKEMTMTQPISPPAESVDLAEAYLAGFNAGRKQCAADIRAKAADLTGSQYRSFEMAARIAEREK